MGGQKRWLQVWGTDCVTHTEGRGWWPAPGMASLLSCAIGSRNRPSVPLRCSLGSQADQAVPKFPFLRCRPLVLSPVTAVSALGPESLSLEVLVSAIGISTRLGSGNAPGYLSGTWMVTREQRAVLHPGDWRGPGCPFELLPEASEGRLCPACLGSLPLLCSPPTGRPFGRLSQPPRPVASDSRREVRVGERGEGWC